MSTSRDPDEDDATGVDNSPEEESLEGFYQAVSLDDLFAATEDDDVEEEGVGGSALAPRHGPLQEAASAADGGASLPSEASERSSALELPSNPASLAGWVVAYFVSQGDRVAAKTLSAKRLDLERFLNFTLDTLGHDHVDAWVPELTRAFLRDLQTNPSQHTGKRLAPASIRRCLATVRHFARWVGERHELPADPLQGISTPRVPPSLPSPLSPADLRQAWRACRARVDAPHRRDQCPLLDAAVFQLLLSTDLRPRELVALDLEDYHSKKLHGVFRRGRQVRTSTWVPAEARRWLNRYFQEVRGATPGPLLLTRNGDRFSSKGIHRVLRRLARSALPVPARFALLTWAVLRHFEARSVT